MSNLISPHNDAALSAMFREVIIKKKYESMDLVQRGGGGGGECLICNKNHSEPYKQHDLHTGIIWVL